MRTLTVIGLSVALTAGAALSSGSADAQQKSLKDQLVGTWMLASCTSPTGSAEVCANPHGMLILEAGGHYAQVLAPHGRPSLSGPRSAISAEQFRATAGNVVANFGTWSVNEADKTLTTRVEGALNPGAEGSDAKFSVSFTVDSVQFVNAGANAATIESMYRRAK